jgi:hypothetical protein
MADSFPKGNSIGCGLRLMKRRSLVWISSPSSLVWTCQKKKKKIPMADSHAWQVLSLFCSWQCCFYAMVQPLIIVQGSDHVGKFLSISILSIPVSFKTIFCIYFPWFRSNDSCTWCEVNFNRDVSCLSLRLVFKAASYLWSVDNLGLVYIYIPRGGQFLNGWSNSKIKPHVTTLWTWQTISLLWH